MARGAQPVGSRVTSRWFSAHQLGLGYAGSAALFGSSLGATTFRVPLAYCSRRKLPFGRPSASQPIGPCTVSTLLECSQSAILVLSRDCAPVTAASSTWPTEYPSAASPGI